MTPKGSRKICLPHFARLHPSLTCLLCVVFILLFGLTLDAVVVDKAKAHERRHFLEYINGMIPGFDPAQVAALSGTAADLDTPQLVEIKRYLVMLRAVNPDYRFVYLMAKQGDNLIFLVDAEDENSEDYSAPGEIYPEASEQLLQIFDTGQPFIEGPVSDSFGTWISAIAPLLNPDDGAVSAVLGIDIDAKQWASSINSYHLFSTIITLLVAVIVVIFCLTLASISKDRDKIRRTNQDLEESLAQVKLLEGIIPICAYCKKIRDDQESWLRVEEYISEHTDAEFSHGMCPDCYEKNLNEIVSEN